MQETNGIKAVLRRWRRTAADFWLNTVHARTVQIAITGSYGKTSTTQGIYAVCAAHADTIKTDVNLDTIYNLPITALRLRNHAYAVLETGIDTLNEMRLHLSLIDPDISIITGIAPVHADAEHMGSVENIIREKRQLIEALEPDEIAILNYDDEQVRAMASHTKARVLWYGLSPEADFSAQGVQVRSDGLRFVAVTPSAEFTVETPLIGRHSAANLMAAAAVGHVLGIPPETIQRAFAGIKPLKGRLNIEDGPLGSTLINDALRANTASTRAGLRFLDDLHAAGAKIAVLGEMGEIGETAAEEHHAIGQLLGELDVDLTVCIGGLTQHITEGAMEAGVPPERVVFVGTVQQAAEVIKARLQPGDTLYLKGSLLKHLERVKLLLHGEQVGCTVMSCPFYHQCDGCPYRVTGYQEVRDAS
jgi:UDP-N-acetylmuramoyl-tripeptide--D-alanyl-D-alanine ligase